MSASMVSGAAEVAAAVGSFDSSLHCCQRPLLGMHIRPSLLLAGARLRDMLHAS
jgi:hypothetical protein